MSDSDREYHEPRYKPLGSEPKIQEERPWEWQPAEGLPNVVLNLPESTGHQSGADSPTSIRRQRLTNRSAKHMGPRESRARKSTWTCIYSTGIKARLHSDKRGVIQKFKLGVPIRDMRLLDPNLLTSESGKILVRDNVIVFSIEHVRLLITADSVIIPREGFDHHPLNIRFNALLDEVIADFAEEASMRQAASLKAHQQLEQDVESGDDDSSDYHHEVAPLPFELQVLEAALKDVTQLANQLTKELEAVAHPALDALTKTVTTPNLERVRKVKTRHQRLYTRVQTIREELQRFLEDDDDMMKMCLTRKKELETTGRAQGTTAHPPNTGTGAINRRQSLSIPMGTPRNHGSFQAQAQGSPPWTTAFERSESGAMQQDAGDESESQEAVENLLESYFMQIDSTHDRLDAIGEYIEDTEEYINIELDSSRNRLLRLEIVLTAGTFGIAMFGLVAGILGENLIIPRAITKDIMGFVLVNVGTFIFCLLLFLGVMCYIKYRRLM